MKFITDEAEYDLFELVRSAGIGDLRDLKKITKGLLDREDGGPAFQGVAPSTFAALWTGIGDRLQEDGVDPLQVQADLQEDENFLLHIQALIWLANRRDNPAYTWAQAGRVPRSGFSIVPSDEDGEDEGDAPDPKAPDSGADADSDRPASETT